jgi:hypothetical protein
MKQSLRFAATKMEFHHVCLPAGRNKYEESEKRVILSETEDLERLHGMGVLTT